MSTYIKVYGRFRPSASNGMDAVQLLDNNRVRLQIPGKEPKDYELHRVFPKSCTQQDVFETVAKRLVSEAVQGVNATIFAYGQTGSGKTHTMLGPGDGWSDPVTKGLIPRSVAYLFENLEQKSKESQRFAFTVSLEFVELYNETIFDLLDSKQKKITLRDTGTDIQLVGAISIQVDSYLDLINVVKRGWAARRTGETAMNRDSSRSHALIIVHVSSEEVMGSMIVTRKSTLNLVDLAGSERQSHTKAAGERLKEATHINGSLSVLGRCIRILSSPLSANTFIPYRESPLTHILKNSLGGNSKTAVIVNMHPDQKFMAETSSTLAFASACAMIKNTVSKNEHMTGESEAAYKEAIRQLKLEIEDIEEKLKRGFGAKIEACEEEKKKLNDLTISLRTNLQEVRTKYRLCLLQQNTDTDQPLPQEISNRLFVDASKTVDGVLTEELLEKIQTLSLENEAKTKEIETMRADLVEQRTNMTQLIDETRCLRTPQSNRRRTRNPRRETIYQPSPARRAVFCDDADEPSSSQQDQNDFLEVLSEKETLETAIEETKSKMSKMADEMMAKEREWASSLSTAEKQCYSLKEEVEKAKSENSMLAEKLERSNKNFDKVLVACHQKKTELEKLAKEKDETELRLNTELNDMLVHFQQQITTLENQNERLSEDVLASKSAYQKVESRLKDSEQKLSESVATSNNKINELMATLDLYKDLTSEKTRLECENLNAVQNMNILKQSNANLVKEAAERNEGHRKELEELAEKKQKQLNEVENKLKLEKEEHERTKLANDQKVSSLNKLYDKKVEKMRSDFDSLIKEELAEKEKDMIAKFKIELEEKEELWNKSKATLEKQIESLQRINEDDTAAMKNVMGHANRDQKISYITKLREQVLSLQADKTQLQNQVAALTDRKRTLRPRN